jgi:uncharacterized membrane protein (DUF373 family)
MVLGTKFQKGLGNTLQKGSSRKPLRCLRRSVQNWDAEVEMLEKLRNAWNTKNTYECFERMALRAVQAVLAFITVYAIVLVVWQVANDALLGNDFMDKAVLQDTFGLILTVLILLEFNHSVHVATSRRAGAIQARMVVLITVLVIARKLILLDYGAVSVSTLLGFAVLLLALGVLYWLIVSSDARRTLPPGDPGP